MMAACRTVVIAKSAVRAEIVVVSDFPFAPYQLGLA